MIAYPKIETLYDRDPANMKHVVPGKLRDPAFGLVDRWLVTEKVDGTNVRVTLDASRYRFGGRTDDAQMPMPLLEALGDLLPYEKVRDAFDPGMKAVLFGEGYGPKIQKGGGDYAASPSFILFDVAVIGDDRVWWLNWSDVKDVAGKLGVETVPVLGTGLTTQEAVELVAEQSVVAYAGTKTDRQQGGIVCRTDPLLFTRKGDRLVWKLKGRDLPDPVTSEPWSSRSAS